MSGPWPRVVREGAYPAGVGASCGHSMKEVGGGKGLLVGLCLKTTQGLAKRRINDRLPRVGKAPMSRHQDYRARSVQLALGVRGTQNRPDGCPWTSIQ